MINNVKAEYCYLQLGCTHLETCQCVPYIMYCDISQIQQGECRFTIPGIIGIAIISIVVVILLSILICGCVCCWIPKCCKRGREQHIHYHSANERRSIRDDDL
jgi:hypothetical protein